MPLQAPTPGRGRKRAAGIFKATPVRHFFVRNLNLIRNQSVTALKLVLCSYKSLLIIRVLLLYWFQAAKKAKSKPFSVTPKRSRKKDRKTGEDTGQGSLFDIVKAGKGALRVWLASLVFSASHGSLYKQSLYVYTVCWSALCIHCCCCLHLEFGSIYPLYSPSHHVINYYLLHNSVEWVLILLFVWSDYK